MQFYDTLLGHELDPQFNSRGHRCKELEELNLHNYILFVGDSISLALDKPIEETYPYIASKKLRMDYYNLSITNGGLDSIKYNILSWNSIQPSKPKLIVVASEFLNSFIVSDKNHSFWKVCDYNDDNVKELFDAGNHNAFFTTRRILADKLIRNTIISPIYQIVLKDRISLFSTGVTNIDSEYDQESIARLIVQEYNKHSRVARP